MILQGRIHKSLSGFYTVHTPEGDYICKPRGTFRKNGEIPLVGDFAEIETDENQKGKGILKKLLPRKNFFLRPSVANVDAMVILASAAIPVTDPFLIDRMTVLCEMKGCEPILVFTKTDVASGETLADIYKNSGYPVILTSAVEKRGIADLIKCCKDKFVVFTGNSGVGKSSLLNAIAPELSLETAEISEKLGRGKHTTRHVEIYTPGSRLLIADTPGFSAFDFSDEMIPKKNAIADFFPELTEFKNNCKFDDCTHRKEPECAVREAVLAKKISGKRYESYIRIFEEAASYKEWK